jgi:DNA-binding NtrC family response regulator
MSDHSTNTILRPQLVKPEGVLVTVVAGPSTGTKARGRKITVGRSKIADLTIKDFTVSEFHLEVTPHERGFEVVDLDSWNGTFSGEVRIHRGVAPNEATIQLGESAIRVSAINLPEAPSNQPVRESFGGLRGKSGAMQKVYDLLQRLAPTDLSIFIEGATGTGKELVARALHDASPYAQGPFVVLDCASLPATLAESVLFGHTAGAFTGAVNARPGVFEAANGGTVFIDEIGELPLHLQPKLLRVLEQRAVTRIGENRSRDVSFRLVSATWRDLRGMINQGRFRDDLFFRLAQARISLPTLQERREDIEMLATSFIHQLPADMPCARSISKEALAMLVARDYPGNIRELRSTIERAAHLSEGAVIRASDLAFERILGRGHDDEPAAAEGADVRDFKEAKRTAVDDFEREYLVRLMTKVRGNIAHAAVLAAIERHHLRALLKKHGLYAQG